MNKDDPRITPLVSKQHSLSKLKLLSPGTLIYYAQLLWHKNYFFNKYTYIPKAEKSNRANFVIVVFIMVFFPQNKKMLGLGLLLWGSELSRHLQCQHPMPVPVRVLTASRPIRLQWPGARIPAPTGRAAGSRLWPGLAPAIAAVWGMS